MIDFRKKIHDNFLPLNHPKYQKKKNGYEKTLIFICL